jgi:hypothetical protein
MIFAAYEREFEHTVKARASTAQFDPECQLALDGILAYANASLNSARDGSPAAC